MWFLHLVTSKDFKDEHGCVHQNCTINLMLINCCPSSVTTAIYTQMLGAWQQQLSAMNDRQVPKDSLL
jgi:hypothetical protein